jgi:hypothetical protein
MSATTPVRFFRLGAAMLVTAGLSFNANASVHAARKVAVPPETSSYNAERLSSSDVAQISDRLKGNLTPELLASFDLFLYVNKAEDGPWAQHMVILSRNDDGGFSPIYVWRVSTGRGQMELAPDGQYLSTDTPTGYFEFDPARFYRHHVSAEWKEAMSYAMFFDWQQNDVKTGLAVHAAAGEDRAELGSPASAGCIRLSPQNAHTLFDLIRSRYRGRVPRFAVDPENGTMSSDGTPARDPDGNVSYADGYRVLVLIDDDDGDENVVTLKAGGAPAASASDDSGDATGLN